MPSAYAIAGSKVADQGLTCYVRPVGPDTTCPGNKPITFRDVSDGTSNTIMVVEVDDAHAVPWSKPADLDYDPEHPAKGLGGHLEGTVFSVFCDGAPHMLRDLLTNPARVHQLRAIFTRGGVEYVERID